MSPRIESGTAPSRAAFVFFTCGVAVRGLRMFTQLALKRCQSLTSQPNWRTGPSIIHKYDENATSPPRLMAPRATRNPPKPSVMSWSAKPSQSRRGRYLRVFIAMAMLRSM